MPKNTEKIQAEERDWTIVPDGVKKRLAMYLDYLANGQPDWVYGEKYGYSEKRAGTILREMLETVHIC